MDARRSKASAIAAAVLLHAGFVAWLVASAHLAPSAASRPDVEVELAPPPADLPPAVVRAQPRAPAVAAVATRPARPTRRPQAPRTDAAPTRPAEASPSVSASTAATPSAETTPARPRTDDGFDADAAARRAIAALFACHSADGAPLDEASRRRCEASRRAQASALPHIADIPPEKRAAYDLQAEADARRRARLEGPLYEPVVRCSGVGSNFGLGCLPPDASHRFRPR